MGPVTLCYSNHRPEVLKVTRPLMASHDVIVLEEPPHTRFQEMLNGDMAIDELLLEMDVEYPLLFRKTYQFLQQMAENGKTIRQVEPYLEFLEQIHFFFAEGGSPVELEPGSRLEEVYVREREATRTLIDFYKASQGASFNRLIAAIRKFALADARRFRLRDSLRTVPLLELLSTGQSVYIEAGAMHRYLYLLLQKRRPADSLLQLRWVEQEIMMGLGLKGQLMSPGDMLTLAYIFRAPVDRDRENLLCARALLYAKIVQKEEVGSTEEEFPHLRHDLEATGLVGKLSFEECSRLYPEVRALSTLEAKQAVKSYLSTG